MEGVKTHVGTNESDRFKRQFLLEPIQDARIRDELPNDHGVRNGVVGESTDPRRLDKAKLRAKVGSDHTQLHRGQDSDGKSGDSHGDSGNIIGKLDQGKKTLGEVHQGNGFVKLAVAHQDTVGDGWTAVGKGRNVDAVVAEGPPGERGISYA